MKLFLTTLISSLMFQSVAFADGIATGTFQGVGQKQTSGDITIKETADGIYLKLESNFETQEGPDLRIVLRDSSGAMQMIVVEPLKAFTGEQEYMLPVSKYGLMKYDQVVIYCAEFHVDFGVAELQ